MTRRTGFRALGDIIRKSAFIVPIYGAIVLLLGVATIRSWLDFTTSLVGARSLFFAEGANYEIQVFSLASMPQLITIVFTYVALATPFNQEMKWLKLSAIAVVMASLAFDIYTGYLYYVGVSYHPLAMSGLADTAFSEVGFTLAFGLTLDLFPDVRKRFAQWSSKQGIVTGYRHKSKPTQAKVIPNSQKVPMNQPLRESQMPPAGQRPPGFPE